MLNKQQKGRLILIGIALIFFVPIFISWYLVFFSNYKDGVKTINHGALISPIIQLGQIEMKSISDDASYVHDGTWMLMFVENDQCEDECKKNLYSMRQIRLALGKDQDKLERLIITKKQLHWEPYRVDYAGQKYIDPSMKFFNKILKASEGANDLNSGSVYLIDPYGNLIMQYPKDTDPKGIIKDIERLIRNAR